MLCNFRFDSVNCLLRAQTHFIFARTAGWCVAVETNSHAADALQNCRIPTNHFQIYYVAAWFCTHVVLFSYDGAITIPIYFHFNVCSGISRNLSQTKNLNLMYLAVVPAHSAWHVQSFSSVALSSAQFHELQTLNINYVIRFRCSPAKKNQLIELLVSS